MWHGSTKRPTTFLASMDIKTAFDVTRPKHIANYEGQDQRIWRTLWVIKTFTAASHEKWQASKTKRLSNMLRWYVFKNHAEWRFGLAPVWCVAPGWRSGARARCCFLPLFSPCVVHARTSVDVHLDSCDRTQAVSVKTVISIAPSSTGL